MDDVQCMKRARMALGTLAALVVVAGCAYDDGTDLTPAVERATPAGASVLAACGGSSGLIESASRSWTFFAPGNSGAVTTEIANASRGDGFDVACRRPGEITAVRDDIRLLAEVTQHGSVDAPGGADDSGRLSRGQDRRVAPATGERVVVERSRARRWQLRHTGPEAESCRVLRQLVERLGNRYGQRRRPSRRTRRRRGSPGLGEGRRPAPTRCELAVASSASPRARTGWFPLAAASRAEPARSVSSECTPERRPALPHVERTSTRRRKR